jgi:hypothetical protein
MIRLLSLIAFIGLSITMTAQNSISIHDENGNEVTNDTVYFNLHPADDLVTHDFTVTNNTDATIGVDSRRFEDECTEGSLEYYCWSLCLTGQTCGTNFVRNMPYATDVAANTTSTFPLALDFDPTADPDEDMGVEGTAMYTYVMFDEDNESDSSYLVVVYNVSLSAGVNEYDNNALSSVYPNPANDVINVKVNQIKEPRFEIYSLVGTKVVGEQIKQNNGMISINVAHLPNGVYMLTELESQLTRRFIISR